MRSLRLITTGLALALMAGLPLSCRSRFKNTAGLRNGSEDLRTQCENLLKSNQDAANQNGEPYSEEGIYRALFRTLEQQAAPLDDDGEAYAVALSTQFLLMSDARYAEGRGARAGLFPNRKKEFENLMRSYVALHGPEVFGGYAQRTAEQQSYFERTQIGKWTNILREGYTAAYYSKVLNLLGGLQNNRGASILDLMVLYALDNYQDVFLVDQMVRSAAAGSGSINNRTPAVLLLNKTTPALACNNYAASVVAERIPWEKLGMDSYQGWGFVPWFHEPIAKFRYEYPVVSSLIPILGAAFDAADSAITVAEGRDDQGQEANRLVASGRFAFFFIAAVFDVYTVKAVAGQAKDFVANVVSRTRGLDATTDGLKGFQAVVKDEAMRADSVARPFMGRNLNPCQIFAAVDWFSLTGTAYAAGLPCFKGIEQSSQLHRNINNAERIGVIKDIRVADVMSAPGHQYLRDPNKVLSLADHITATGGTGFAKEPIAINIFTNTLNDGSVAVRSIEVTDGNHRLAAGLLSGKWKTISDIPPEFLNIKVNGWSAGGGFSEPRWIPLEVAQQSSIPRQSWFEVPSNWKNVRGPTAQIPGDIASIDAVIPTQFQGVPMQQVLKTSLERINAPIPDWLQ